MDTEMEVASGQPSITSDVIVSPDDEDLQEVLAAFVALRASDAATLREPGSNRTEEVKRTEVGELDPDLVLKIFGMLPLRDFVRVHYGCSKKWRALTCGRVFEGEPFFVREHCPTLVDGHIPFPESNGFYVFSMQKWVQLALPSTLQHLRPVSTSSGLVLYTGIPGHGIVEIRRQWWPLVVVNPITRVHHSLLLTFEPREHNPSLEEEYPNFYCEVLMGLKVDAHSQTYKVVVHWMAFDVVQIFDSSSNQWSTVTGPRRLISYADSSNEIVFCRNRERGFDRHSIVFDITHQRLVGCAEMEANDRNRDDVTWGFPVVGESCLYVLSFGELFVRIHKLERDCIGWEVVTEVPMDILCSYLHKDLLDPNVGHFIVDSFRCEGLLNIHECGKHLLLTASHGSNWCGMMYDKDQKHWTGQDVVDMNTEKLQLVHDGLFFQPQLHGLQGC